MDSTNTVIDDSKPSTSATTGVTIPLAKNHCPFNFNGKSNYSADNQNGGVQDKKELEQKLREFQVLDEVNCDDNSGSEEGGYG